MDFLRKLLNELFEQTPNQTPITSPVYHNYHDLLLDWAKDADMDLPSWFEKDLPAIYQIFLEKNERLRNYHENGATKKQIEAFKQTLTFQHLCYLLPSPTYLRQLKQLSDREMEIARSIYYSLESIRNLGYRFRDIPHYSHLKVGAYYAQIFYTIEKSKSKGSAYRDEPANLGYRLDHLKFFDKEQFFSILTFLGKQSFLHKVYVLSEMYSKQQFDQRNLVMTHPGEGPLNEAIRQQLVRAANEHQTSYETVSLQTQAILGWAEFTKIRYTAGWVQEERNTKNRNTSILPEVAPFIEEASQNPQAYLMAASYWCVFSSKAHLFLPILKQLAQHLTHDSDFMNRWLSFIVAYRHNGLFEVAFGAMRRHQAAYHYDDPAVQTCLRFAYQNNVRSKEVLSFIDAMVHTIQDPERQNFMRHAHAHWYVQMTMDRARARLRLPDDRRRVIKYLVKELNKILPIALKSTDKWYDDPEFGRQNMGAVINYQGKDYVIGDILYDTNEFLQEVRAHYRMVPIPLFVDEKSGRQQAPYDRVGGMSLLSRAEYRYLKNQYLPKHMREMRDWWGYKKIDEWRNIHEAPSFFTLAAPKTDKRENLFLEDVNWHWFRKDYVDKLSSKDKWVELMDYIVRNKGIKKAQKKWLAEAMKAVDNFGQEQFLRECQALMTDSLKEDFWYNEHIRKAFRGLMWVLIHIEDDQAIEILRMITESAYRKIPGVGPRSSATGNAALWILAQSGKESAFGALAMMRNKTKYHRFIKVLDKHIDLYKKGSPLSEEELADRALPAFGFVAGEKRIPVGDHQLILFVKNRKIAKRWEDPNGNTQKSVPTILKLEHETALKEANQSARQISKAFGDLKHRIRTYWLHDRVWIGKDWKAHLMHHPLMSFWLDGLVWEDVRTGQSFLLDGDKCRLTNQATCEIGDEDQIRLWHPIHANQQEISDWQLYALTYGIQQPERQIFREHYPFSPEELASKQTVRFAHHFLSMNKLMAIANAAGWVFTYVHQGFNWPRTYIKALDLTAHLHCGYDSGVGVIPTKELFFTRGDTRDIAYSNPDLLERIPLKEVPTVALTELCRGIDLLIATSSVVHDPELLANVSDWEDYHRKMAIGNFTDNPSAVVRRQILQKILPTINKKALRFDGNYVVLTGIYNTYRINLGSGHAQIYDSQEHLDFVAEIKPVKRKFGKRLPVEDDETLYQIIGKLMMLRNENEIEDVALRERLISSS
ncbi:MAG: DUF4132 domain-containing protein [Bacteroidota bacterium]